MFSVFNYYEMDNESIDPPFRDQQDLKPSSESNTS